MNKKTKKTERKVFSCDTEGELAQKRMIESKEYILSNWSAVKVRLSNREGIVGCSAEGHVSHVLSSRMSSRPMGWSKIDLPIYFLQ